MPTDLTPEAVDLRELRLALLAGRDLTPAQRQALLGWLPSQIYTLQEAGRDAAGRTLWRVAAPGYRASILAGTVGFRYLSHLAARPAGEAPEVLDPDSTNARQAVDGACRRAISQLEQHCLPLADLLCRALTVGRVARLLLPPGVAIKTGNAVATRDGDLA